MTRFNQLLAGLFAIQLLLATGIYLGSQPAAVAQAETPLLAADSTQIDRITIDEGDGKPLRLIKEAGQWQLPDYFTLPADARKVEQLLERLARTKTGWPVATTAASRKRFEVSDDGYQKRITLAHGDDTLQRLYLGTSPGFRQLHLRREGDDAVYAVQLNSYDFPAEPGGWLDRTLAQPNGEITGLEGPDFRLTRQDDDSWQPSDGRRLVEAELEKLLQGLGTLSVQEAVDKKTPDNSYRLRVESRAGEVVYHLFKEQESHYLSHSDYSPVFKISAYDYERITGQDAGKLFEAVTGEEADPAADQAPPPEPSSEE